jgi:hypothetical protein
MEKLETLKYKLLESLLHPTASDDDTAVACFEKMEKFIPEIGVRFQYVKAILAEEVYSHFEDYNKIRPNEVALLIEENYTYLRHLIFD